MPKKQSITILIIVLLALALAACQGAPAPTSTTAQQPAGTIPAAVDEPTNTPAAPDAATAYPAGEEQTQAEPTPASEVPTEDYPVPDEGPGPANVPAVDNHSTVTARLVSLAPDEQDPSITLLKVEIIKAVPLENSPDFTSGLAGKEVDLNVVSTDLPQINPGDTFEADVSFRGDEKGGKYFATQVTKVEP